VSQHQTESNTYRLVAVTHTTIEQELRNIYHPADDAANGTLGVL
jgi:hypothetical protein